MAGDRTLSVDHAGPIRYCPTAVRPEGGPRSLACRAGTPLSGFRRIHRIRHAWESDKYRSQETDLSVTRRGPRSDDVRVQRPVGARKLQGVGPLGGSDAELGRRRSRGWSTPVAKAVKQPHVQLLSVVSARSTIRSALGPTASRPARPAPRRRPFAPPSRGARPASRRSPRRSGREDARSPASPGPPCGRRGPALPELRVSLPVLARPDEPDVHAGIVVVHGRHSDPIEGWFLPVWTAANDSQKYMKSYLFAFV